MNRDLADKIAERLKDNREALESLQLLAVATEVRLARTQSRLAGVQIATLILATYTILRSLSGH